MSKLALAASYYAARLGWRVFPLRVRGKEPLGKLAPHGVKDATSDQMTVLSSWTAEPNANIGLACGGSFFVVDVDPRNYGDETLGALEAANGKLPTTVTSLTGGGGQHYFFQHPDGRKLAGTLGEGLDIKSTGGYIVAPPSVHPNGGEYRWEAGSNPVEIPIAQAPAWMLAALAGPTLRSLGPATGAAAESFLAKCFDVAGWLGKSVDGGRVIARCPWSHEHTPDAQGVRTGDGRDTSCVVLAPTPERPLGTFCCRHGHCATRGNYDALMALPEAAIGVVAHSMPEQFDETLKFIARMST